ncbi:MAG: efflux RND transporter periplasmic adaptor subunit [Myxococcales bacterium]|nr:efflux RND transporter periplasmic adaptor subunit [Myxococcales bacterium]
MSVSRTKLGWTFIAVAAVVAVAAFARFRHKEGPKVRGVHPVVRPLVETLVTTGRVTQRRQSDLGAMAQGTVVKVLVDAGDRVEAKALLVQLSDDEAQARLKEAKATVAEAEARLKRLHTVDRRLAGQSLKESRQAATHAQAQYTRQAKLFAARTIAKTDLERARRQRDTTRNARVAATVELAASAPKGSSTAQALAVLSRAQAGLHAAEVAVRRAQIRAPSAGVVLLRHVEPGEVVQPGKVLVTFAGDGPLEIQIQPDESNLGRLAVGQTALVSPEAFPDRRLAAKVVFIAPSVDPARGTVEVKLSIVNQTDLRPAMTVAVEIEVKRAARALVLPANYVRDLGTDAPWALVAVDGVAERRQVSLGLIGDEMVQITSGLAATDVVLSATLALRNGDTLRLQGADPAATK